MNALFDTWPSWRSLPRSYRELFPTPNPRTEPRRDAAIRMAERLRFKGRVWVLQPEPNRRYIAWAERLERFSRVRHIDDNGYHSWEPVDA